MMSMDYSKKQKQKYKELNRRLMQYVAMVNQIYQSYNEEASRIAMTTGYNSDSEGDFKFSDYPKTKYSIEKLQRNFADNMQALIYSGISKEWKNSNDAQDLLANEILKKYKGQVNGEKQKIIYQTNSDAMKAFANRTDKGLDLSDKVWKQSDEYVRALEAAISTAISKGTSAVTLSKQISKYLIDFDKLQKDYKSQFGQATDIHDCEYRSARLARSEINMAYRTAEQTRWNEMDFVRGYRIELSNNHSDRRKKHGEYSDICDELQGDYPKDFKWTGWHPNCRCHAVPLLMSEEDFIRWNNGESVDKNLIKDVPENYKRWAAENADKIEQAGARGTQPYFVRDNKKYMQEAKRSAENKKGLEAQSKPDLTNEAIFKKHFTTRKKFENGGSVNLMNDIDKSKSDYKDILTISTQFAKEGKTVGILSRTHYKSDTYKEVFASLIGTKYDRKCPDILIGNKFYEYESFNGQWSRRKISNMLSHGLLQSNYLIIDNTKGGADRIIRKAILARLKINQQISEVYLFEKGILRLFFKDGKFIKNNREF